MPVAPRRRSAGFSLVELMVSVTIIAILAALAIPSYVRYIVRSKSVEAAMGVRKLFDAAAAYYSTERADAAGVPVRRQFPPTQTWTPVLNACCNPPPKRRPLRREPRSLEDADMGGAQLLRR